MSNESRNETQLVCDILGLESLVDEITSAQLAKDTHSPSDWESTSSAILGPFYRHNAPVLPNGSSIIAPPKRREYLPHTTHLSGRVLCAGTGQPIRNAVVDVWHTGPDGMYEQQDENQPDMNLRGRFRTDDKGRYEAYCLRPVPYPIPYDGPGGKLLKLLDRHPYRPAHIHFIVTADGYRPLTTQLFDREDKYLEDDSVFAVKNDLVVDYLPRDGDSKARWTLEYDFVLCSG
jgi:catechol 1,2-dioxygenase